MSQLPPALTDPAKVPSFTLVPVDRDANGMPLTAATWPAQRARLLDLFAQTIYGRSPGHGWTLCVRVDREDPIALGGLAVRSEILVTIATSLGERALRILVHRPARVHGAVPCLLGLNFAGNHTTVPDDWPTLPTAWVPVRTEDGSPGGQARNADRGILARRWPVAALVAQGFAVATLYSGDIEPDRPDGWRDGLRSLFPDADPATAPGDAWGTLAVWAFGLRRALDALLAAVPEVDPARIGVIGHSRLGKTALWSAAQDERFAVVMSNDSGCTGAAIARRRFGERQLHMNTYFPHWCCRNYHAFNEREADLPVDQHQLLALIAPRLLHVASAEQDLWADPDGELLACIHAAPAWKVLGIDVGALATPPPLDAVIGHRVSYHRRPGTHDLTAVDWYRLLTVLRGHGWGAAG